MTRPRAGTRAGLFVTALILLVLLVAIDLSRPGSWLRAAWPGGRERPPLERAIDQYRGRRPVRSFLELPPPIQAPPAAPV